MVRKWQWSDFANDLSIIIRAHQLWRALSSPSLFHFWPVKDFGNGTTDPSRLWSKGQQWIFFQSHKPSANQLVDGQTRIQSLQKAIRWCNCSFCSPPPLLLLHSCRYRPMIGVRLSRFPPKSLRHPSLSSLPQRDERTNLFFYLCFQWKLRRSRVSEVCRATFWPDRKKRFRSSSQQRKLSTTKRIRPRTNVKSPTVERQRRDGRIALEGIWISMIERRNNHKFGIEKKNSDERSNSSIILTPTIEQPVFSPFLLCLLATTTRMFLQGGNESVLFSKEEIFRWEMISLERHFFRLPFNATSCVKRRSVPPPRFADDLLALRQSLSLSFNEWRHPTGSARQPPTSNASTRPSSFNRSCLIVSCRDASIYVLCSLWSTRLMENLHWWRCQKLLMSSFRPSHPEDVSRPKTIRCLFYPHVNSSRLSGEKREMRNLCSFSLLNAHFFLFDHWTDDLFHNSLTPLFSMVNKGISLLSPSATKWLKKKRNIWLMTELIADRSMRTRRTLRDEFLLDTFVSPRPPNLFPDGFRSIRSASDDSPSRLAFIRRERSSFLFFFFSICSAGRSSPDFSIATRPLCDLEKPIESSKSFVVRFISLQGRFPRRNAFLRVQSASNGKVPPLVSSPLPRRLHFQDVSLRSASNARRNRRNPPRSTRWRKSVRSPKSIECSSSLLTNVTAWLNEQFDRFIGKISTQRFEWISFDDEIVLPSEVSSNFV